MTREPEATEDRPDPRLREALRAAELTAGPGALDDVFARVSDDVAREDAHPLARLRARSTRARRAIAIASFIALFGFAITQGARGDLALYPLPRLVLECAAYVVLLVLSIFAAVRSEALPALPRARVALLVALGVVAAVVLAVAPAPHALPIHLVGRESDAFMGGGSPCMYVGLTLGLPVYVVLRLVDRGSPLASVLAASAAGLLANLVLQVHCPVTSVGHRLVGHASIGPILLVSLGVALALERLLGRSRSR